MWDWGDAGTWVTGLFTAGSLVLGFSILRNDKRKEERSEAAKVHARTVGTWDNSDKSNEFPYGVRIKAISRSETPMFEVRMYAVPIRKKRLHRMSRQSPNESFMTDAQLKQLDIGEAYFDLGADDLLEAGDIIAGLFELSADPKYYNTHVEFSDINAMRWIRPADSWELIRYPKRRFGGRHR